MGFVVDRISVPVVDVATGKLHVDAFCSQRIARRVAGAAMRQSLDEIGAAIPLRAPGTVWLIAVAAKKQQFPAGDNRPLVEREGKLVRARRRMNRLSRHQEGI